ncbi:MAG: hypothetical protein JST26_20190 [Bacteroidetes bacterium]|nr:hypothetical protein [Bacteroidota bacterium]
MWGQDVCDFSGTKVQVKARLMAPAGIDRKYAIPDFYALVGVITNK